MRLNSVSQCCSSVSPTILVDSRAFMSRRRSIASSRSLICVSYLSFSAFSASCFSSSARASRPLFSSSRSFRNRAHGLGDGELLRQLDGLEPGLQALDLGVLRRGGLLQLVHQHRLGQPGRGLLVLPGLLEFVGQRVALLLDGAQRLGHGQLARHLAGIETGLQPLDLGVLGGGGLLQFAGEPGRGQLDGIALVLLGQFEPLVQLLLEGPSRTCFRMSA
jgi:hypothetical protein